MTESTGLTFECPALRCQRWRDGVGSWRPAAEGLVVSRYGVDVVQGDSEARAFPAARFRVGLYRARPLRGAELVGIAVFSEPAQRAAVPRWLGAERHLVERGAPPRRPFEEGAAYVARALVEGGFRSEIHPGKLVYAFGLGRRERRAIAPNPEAYPSRGADAAVVGGAR